MKSNSVILILALLFGGFHLNAQDLALEESEFPESEFDVAINPTDNNNIVVATMRTEEAFTSSLSIYYTTDFGETWAKSEFEGLNPS